VGQITNLAREVLVYYTSLLDELSLFSLKIHNKRNVKLKAAHSTLKQMRKRKDGGEGSKKGLLKDFPGKRRSIYN